MGVLVSVLQTDFISEELVDTCIDLHQRQTSMQAAHQPAWTSSLWLP
jgi:hypothetical protein